MTNRYKHQYSKKPKKRKSIDEKGIRELTKVLDKVFSEYIRLKFSDDNGYCRCVTCGSIRKWNDIDNGHFINRDVKATRFDEINCRPQCVSCNHYHSGKAYKFRQALVEIYGEKEIKDMERKAELGGSFCAYQLREMIIEYREKVRMLKNEKCL